MSSNTRAACVIGWPARQSRSPKLHGYWIKRYKIDGDYRIEEISPEAFPAFIRDLGGNGYVGANITMPHKDAALALSEPDDRARAIGAATTLWLHPGKPRSTNTDVTGFLGPLGGATAKWGTALDRAVGPGARGHAAPVKGGGVGGGERGGGRGASGVGMLLHQAVRGFELWFGIRPEVTRELFDLLAADIPQT